MQPRWKIMNNVFISPVRGELQYCICCEKPLKGHYALSMKKRISDNNFNVHLCLGCYKGFFKNIQDWIKSHEKELLVNII